MWREKHKGLKKNLMLMLESRRRWSGKYAAKFAGCRLILKPLIVSRDGAVVRPLASHYCGPLGFESWSWHHTVYVGCQSLLLVLVPARRVFSPDSPVFLIPQNQFFLETMLEEPLCRHATSCHFIYLLGSIPSPLATNGHECTVVNSWALIEFELTYTCVHSLGSNILLSFVSYS